MLYVNGKVLPKGDNWSYMMQQVEEFRAACDAFTEGAPLGKAPLTQKYFNKLYYLMEQEVHMECTKLPSCTTSEKSAS